VSQCVGFNVPRDTETSLSRQSTTMVLTTANKESKHYIYLKCKRKQRNVS